MDEAGQKPEIDEADAADMTKMEASLRQQPTSAEDVADHVGWFDYTLGADHWFSLKDIEPERAAMLLCQLNPNTETLEQAKQCTNDVTGPEDFLRLLQRFEDLVKCEPQRRSLLEWLHFARASKLRHHPWIDQYVEAAGRALGDPAAAEPAPTAGAPKPSEKDARDWQAKARAEAKRIRKERVANGLFPNLQVLGDEVARVFRERGIKGPNGHPLSGAYIKRWALQRYGITNNADRLQATLNTRGK